MRFSWICILGLLSTTISANASAELPQGPLLNSSSDFSTWQITYSYPEDQKKGTPAPPPPPSLPGSISILPPRSITVTWTKPLWHSIIVDTGGTKSELWSDGTCYAFQQNGSPFAMYMTLQYLKFPDFSSVSFPDTNWISPATYTGLESVGGRQCLIFTHDNMRAWIDLQSRFPLQWTRGGEKRIFQQLSPSSTMLDLPPEVKKLFSDMHKALDLLKKPIPS